MAGVSDEFTRRRVETWYKHRMDGTFNTSAELELARRLGSEGRDPGEADRFARLVLLFLVLPKPPDAAANFPRFEQLRDRLESMIATGSAEELEESFLELYAHLHLHEAPYTAEERRRVDRSGGYWCHAGGLSPILKAGHWLEAGSTSVDLGAGNGLQGLLFQKLGQFEPSLTWVDRALEAARAFGDDVLLRVSQVEWSPDVVAASAMVHDLGLGRRFPGRALLISRLSIVVLVALAVAVALYLVLALVVVGLQLRWIHAITVQDAQA